MRITNFKKNIMRMLIKKVNKVKKFFYTICCKAVFMVAINR